MAESRKKKKKEKRKKKEHSREGWRPPSLSSQKKGKEGQRERERLHARFLLASFIKG
jgi:hypothetical protein